MLLAVQLAPMRSRCGFGSLLNHKIDRLVVVLLVLRGNKNESDTQLH